MFQNYLLTGRRLAITAAIVFAPVEPCADTAAVATLAGEEAGTTGARDVAGAAGVFDAADAVVSAAAAALVTEGTVPITSAGAAADARDTAGSRDTAGATAATAAGTAAADPKLSAFDFVERRRVKAPVISFTLAACPCTNGVNVAVAAEAAEGRGVTTAGAGVVTGTGDAIGDTTAGATNATAGADATVGAGNAASNNVCIYIKLNV